MVKELLHYRWRKEEVYNSGSKASNCSSFLSPQLSLQPFNWPELDWKATYRQILTMCMDSVKAGLWSSVRHIYVPTPQLGATVNSFTVPVSGNTDVYRNQQWCISESICTIIIQLLPLLVWPFSQEVSELFATVVYIQTKVKSKSGVHMPFLNS